MCYSVVYLKLFAVVSLFLRAQASFSAQTTEASVETTTSHDLPAVTILTAGSDLAEGATVPGTTVGNSGPGSTDEATAQGETTNSEESASSFGSTTSSFGTTTAAYPVPDVCSESISRPIRNFDIITDGLLTPFEGLYQQVICKMKLTDNETCNDAFRELVNSTKIYAHHKDNKENFTDHAVVRATKTITEDDSESLFTVRFNFTVWHKDHNERSIYCRAFSDFLNSTIVSKKKEFETIDKLYKVTVTPSHLEVPPNTAFTLTCSFEHIEVKDFIFWRSKKASDDHQWVEVENSIEEKGMSSVLTVTKNKEWNGTYMCTSRSNRHPNKHRSEASVLVKAPDKSVIQGTTIAIVVTAVIVLLAVVALLIRRRALKKKIEISLMLMELQEAGAANANAQQTPMLGSVHSLSMEPAVNCYASSLNSDGSLAAETLAATFARFTSMYAPWQKDRTKLVIKHILGEGNFGSVCLGIMPDVYFQGVSSQVAVKTIKPARMDKQAITEFEKEVSIMTTLQHDNIVNLVGLCTETMPLYIIMEYMENGPLNDFLMGKAPNKLEDTTLSTRDLLYMSLQPCKALEYLSNKNVVHRDISARNCLVGDKLSVKLADFGLSRGTAVDDGKNYYKKDGGMVPVKWMAPEALNFGKYTSANDVWSFGVLMWEVFSFGAIPYLSHSNQQVIVFVNRGGRLEKPDYCPQSVWEHICLCWTKAPEDRITIGGLVNMLSTELDIIDTSHENGQTSQSFDT